MRKNPYLKQEQEFRPLLMRGSLGNDFLLTSEQTRQELTQIWGASKETYNLNGISFDMVLASPLGTDGRISLAKNVEMCTTECTQELFEEVMGFNYSKFKDKDDSAQRPIEMVTWYDCIVFCNKLSEMLGYAPYYDVAKILSLIHGDTPRSIVRAEVNIIGGNGFRLPTEAEWLIFAKAGTNKTWAGTNDYGEEVEDYAWCKENSKRETHPVATKKPNEWGMYDMTGNVSEWVWDKYDVTDTTTSADRITCGSGWYSFAFEMHLVSQSSFPPGNSSNGCGFRFARTVE